MIQAKRFKQFCHPFKKISYPFNDLGKAFKTNSYALNDSGKTLYKTLYPFNDLGKTFISYQCFPIRLQKILFVTNSYFHV